MTTPLILPWKGIMPRIAADAFIAPNATVIGDVEIGSLSSIWFGVVIRGDVSRIRIGARTNIQDLAVVHVSSQGGEGGTPAIIGDDALVGHSAIVHGCTVEDGAFIGMASTVLDGAVVEREAMVAAGALVGPRKRIPSRELWAGAPARFMRKLTDADIAGFRENCAQYAENGAIYRRQLYEKG